MGSAYVYLLGELHSETEPISDIWLADKESAPGVVSGGLVEIRNPGRNPGPKKWKSGIRAEIRSPKNGNPESGQKSGPKSGNPESGQKSGAQKAEIRNPGRSPEPKC